MEFTAWPHIVSFYNIRKCVTEFPALMEGKSNVTYRGKIKLHGSNAGIKIIDKEIGVQSRGGFITPKNDNAGFAAWVMKNQEAWLKIGCPDKEYTIFGEWCGPGIQKGCGIHQIPNRIFAVFAITCKDQNLEDFIVEPDEISKIIGNIPNVYILPWYGEPIAIDWLEDAEKLESIAAAITAIVDEIDKCDPWVKEVFDQEGVGEGSVYYPISHPGIVAFSNLCFKAKGDQHKIVSSIKAAQVEPPKVEGLEAFAELVVTESRLEQAVRAVASGELNFDVKNTGKFLEWIVKDIQRETTAEMTASGLEWKPVSKAVATKARMWYMIKVAKQERE